MIKKRSKESEMKIASVELELNWPKRSTAQHNFIHSCCKSMLQTTCCQCTLIVFFFIFCSFVRSFVWFNVSLYMSCLQTQRQDYNFILSISKYTIKYSQILFNILVRQQPSWNTKQHQSLGFGCSIPKNISKPSSVVPC